MSRLLVSGGVVHTPEGAGPWDVLLDRGQIAALLPPGSGPGGVPVLDAGGCHVLPGVIDPHVHFREPGLEHKEDWEHGSAAAVAGGVTTVLDMPNTRPPVTGPAELAAKARLIAGRSHCHYGLYGMLASGNADQVVGLCGAGAIGLKVFLGESTASLPPPDDGELLGAWRQTALLGLRTAVHAENGAILSAAAHWASEVRNLAGHGLSRPAIAEVEATSRACLLAEHSRAPILIVHLSTAGSVGAVREAKRRGVDVRGETCPQYLLLTEAEVIGQGGLGKVNPPIRHDEDRQALWEGIADGTIDQIGSDHAPHTPEEKGAGADPFGLELGRVSSGFAGVQTLLPLLLSEAGKGRLSLERVVQLTAEGPARNWGLWPRKGRIAPGADGDLAIVRMGQPVAPPSALGRNPQSPFSGWSWGAEVTATIVGGRFAYQGGRIVGRPRGEWVRR